MLERRHFLKIAAGASLLVVMAGATTAQAAPYLLRRPDNDTDADNLNADNLTGKPEPDLKAEPALATQDDVDALQLEQVQWRRRRWGWRRRWRRRYWRPRYYWRPRRRRWWRRPRYYWRRPRYYYW